MNLEEIKQWLDANKDDEEVSKYLNSLSAIDAVKVESYLETDEGQRLLRPRLDKNFTKGLETWKENNLSKIVEEEVAKRNPEETPEQKQIRELTERLNKAEQEKLRTQRLNDINKRIADEKLPNKLSALAPFILADEEEALETNFNTLKEVFEQVQSSIKESFVKDNGRDPQGGGSADSKDGKLEQVAKAFFGEGNKDAFAEKASQQYFKEE